MKRTVKKISAVFMAVVLMITMLLSVCVTATADNAPVFTLNKVDETDTTVTVSVSLKSGEFRYATFILSYNNKISACTSVENGTVLANTISTVENVMASSNPETCRATVISVPTLNTKGEYFVFTFSKAVADEIGSDDITAVEDEVNAQIVNNLSGVTEVDVTLSETDIVLYDGEEKQLSATLSPETGEEIMWTSDDENVATVTDGLVIAVDFGETVITASTQSGFFATCTVKVDLKLKEDASAEIESGFIFGSSVFGGTAQEVKALFENSNVTVSSQTQKIATGDTITFKKANGDVYKTLTVVIFGDVNCDGVYDGNDATIVNCLVAGMLTQTQVGEAVYTAADCNHDGIIDEFDSELLNNAGLLLSLVPQTQSGVLNTQSVEYVNYLSCISQDIEKETDQTDEPAQTDIIETVISFLKSVIDYIVKIIMKLFA